jgi:hypothetical protein
VSTRTESIVTAPAGDAGLGAGGTVTSRPGAEQQAVTAIPGVQDATFLSLPELQSPEDGTRVIRAVHPESHRPAVCRVAALS